MKMKPLFGTQSRFTTPDKASAIFVYDALNLFFSVVLSKYLGPLATVTVHHRLRYLAPSSVSVDTSRSTQSRGSAWLS